jgi:DNA end-binding protein Ku
VAPRANWKGFIKVGELTCPVALYTAASTGDRIAFHTVNRATGHRVHRQFIDQETGEPVEKEAQVKGYEVSKGEYIMLEPEEVASAVPESDKTLDVQAFIKCDDIDDAYFDRPYYLAPTDAIAEEAFAVLREGMRKQNVAALARTVLFRRVRTVFIRPRDLGMIGTTLHFDYEVRSAREAFDDISDVKITGEMLDLAKHIISTKRGTFDPEEYHDRYEQALAELVRAKLEGKEIKIRKAPAETKVVDLMEALRKSAGVEVERAPRAKSKKRAAGGKAKKAASKKATAETRRPKAG